MEGFFCLVRNNADFFIEPQWFFTSPELENYMPIATRKTWDTGEIGAKLEAFAIAGCDPASTYLWVYIFCVCVQFTCNRPPSYVEAAGRLDEERNPRLGEEEPW